MGFLKKLYVLLVIAVVVAVAASFRWEPMPLEEKLVRLQAEAAFPELAEALKDEPVAVHAVLLDYVDDKVLLLKAQAALLKYPELSRKILPLYGPEPEFREILLAHGDSIFPPIGYFLSNDVRTVALMHYTRQKMRSAKDAVGQLWNSKPTSAEDAAAEQSLEAATATVAEPASKKTAELTPQERGWYAVNFIRNEGHNFLGQFVVDGQGETRWIQSERFLEGANAFFASGIRTLETRARTGQEITAADIGWATVDMVAIVGATHLLRLGKSAATTTKATKPAAAGSRAANLASRMGRAGLKGARYAKWPAIALTGYVAIKHPGIINDLLAAVAKAAELPIWLVQLAGWTLILLPLLYLGSWIMRLLLRPTLALLRLLVRVLAMIDQKRHQRSQTATEVTVPSNNNDPAAAVYPPIKAKPHPAPTPG